MNKTLLPLLLCFAVASPLAVAQTKDEHSAHHPQGQAAPAAGAEAPPPSAAADVQPGPSAVDQGMKRLQDLMTQIEQSSDPAERESLLHEHMLVMLEQIKLVRSQTGGMNMAMMMMGGGKDSAGGQMGMMGGDKKKSGTKSGKKDKGGGMMGEGMMGAGMMGMHKMMEQRLGVAEALLEQSIKHAHMREAAEH